MYVYERVRVCVCVCACTRACACVRVYLHAFVDYSFVCVHVRVSSYVCVSLYTGAAGRVPLPQQPGRIATRIHVSCVNESTHDPVHSGEVTEDDTQAGLCGEDPHGEEREAVRV